MEIQCWISMIHIWWISLFDKNYSIHICIRSENFFQERKIIFICIRSIRPYPPRAAHAMLWGGSTNRVYHGQHNRDLAATARGRPSMPTHIGRELSVIVIVDLGVSSNQGGDAPVGGAELGRTRGGIRSWNGWSGGMLSRGARQRWLVNILK
jgi:hypothetical protein